MTVFIGIDNGVTGRITVLKGLEVLEHIATPTVKSIYYGKTAANRINRKELKNILNKYKDDCFLCLEKPVTGGFANQVSSGARSFEATLIVIEDMNLRFDVIEAKEWQKKYLPKKTKGRSLIKRLANQYAKRNYGLETKDGDSVLIAKLAQEKYRED